MESDYFISSRDRSLAEFVSVTEHHLVCFEKCAQMMNLRRVELRRFVVVYSILAYILLSGIVFGEKMHLYYFTCVNPLCFPEIGRRHALRGWHLPSFGYATAPAEYPALYPNVFCLLS